MDASNGPPVDSRIIAAPAAAPPPGIRPMAQPLFQQGVGPPLNFQGIQALRPTQFGAAAGGVPLFQQQASQAQPQGATGRRVSVDRAKGGSQAGAGRKQCNCKNSRCLKLYCECFASGRYCENCNCLQCCNNRENESTRQSAVEAILERNPNAFRPKIQAHEQAAAAATTVVTAGAPGRHLKGCNCKKSFCLKKYCECFQAGIYCSDNCKCVDCKNFEDAGAAAAGTGLGAGAKRVRYSSAPPPSVGGVPPQGVALPAGALAAIRPALMNANLGALLQQHHQQQQQAGFSGSGGMSVGLALPPGLAAAVMAPLLAPGGAQAAGGASRPSGAQLAAGGGVGGLGAGGMQMLPQALSMALAAASGMGVGAPAAGGSHGAGAGAQGMQMLAAPSPPLPPQQQQQQQGPGGQQQPQQHQQQPAVPQSTRSGLYEVVNGMVKRNVIEELCRLLWLVADDEAAPARTAGAGGAVPDGVTHVLGPSAGETDHQRRPLQPSPAMVMTTATLQPQGQGQLEAPSAAAAEAACGAGAAPPAAFEPAPSNARDGIFAGAAADGKAAAIAACEVPAVQVREDAGGAVAAIDRGCDGPAGAVGGEEEDVVASQSGTELAGGKGDVAACNGTAAANGACAGALPNGVEAGAGPREEGAGAAEREGLQQPRRPGPLYGRKERVVLEEFLSILNKISDTAAKKLSQQQQLAAQPPPQHHPPQHHQQQHQQLQLQLQQQMLLQSQLVGAPGVAGPRPGMPSQGQVQPFVIAAAPATVGGVSAPLVLPPPAAAALGSQHHHLPQPPQSQHHTPPVGQGSVVTPGGPYPLVRPATAIGGAGQPNGQVPYTHPLHASVEVGPAVPMIRPPVLLPTGGNAAAAAGVGGQHPYVHQQGIAAAAVQQAQQQHAGLPVILPPQHEALDAPVMAPAGHHQQPPPPPSQHQQHQQQFTALTPGQPQQALPAYGHQPLYATPFLPYSGAAQGPGVPAESSLPAIVDGSQHLTHAHIHQQQSTEQQYPHPQQLLQPHDQQQQQRQQQQQFIPGAPQFPRTDAEGASLSQPFAPQLHPGPDGAQPADVTAVVATMTDVTAVVATMTDAMGAAQAGGAEPMVLADANGMEE